jgi:plasmid stabilization system protein ParE
MASKPLRFDPRAEQDYLTALAWYQERSITAASNFEHAVQQAIEKIHKTPQRWRVYFGDFRKYLLRQFPFNVVYLEFSSEIRVYAVAHTSRLPGYWRSLTRR